MEKVVAREQDKVNPNPSLQPCVKYDTTGIKLKHACRLILHDSLIETAFSPCHICHYSPQHKSRWGYCCIVLRMLALNRIITGLLCSTILCQLLFSLNHGDWGFFPTHRIYSRNRCWIKNITAALFPIHYLIWLHWQFSNQNRRAL